MQCVYHSHAFDIATQYKTAMTEGRFWGQHFGFDLHPDPKGTIAALDARDRAYAVRMGAGPKPEAASADQPRDHRGPRGGLQGLLGGRATL